MTFAVSWASKGLLGRREKASTSGLWKPQVYETRLTLPSLHPKLPSGLYPASLQWGWGFRVMIQPGPFPSLLEAQGLIPEASTPAFLISDQTSEPKKTSSPSLTLLPKLVMVVIF